MSAADRMVVRTLDGSYRSVPRRQGLGMIAAGRAQAAHSSAATGYTATVDTAGIDPLGPHGDEYQVPVTPQQLVVTPDVAPVAAPVHLVTPEPMLEPADDLPAEPRGNASRQEWAAYAVSLGVEVTDDMTRNKIRDAAQDAAQSLARLPQPALPGGRLETPEDEPVTEESVTDDEDPGTR